jgi:hypothetical protein
MVIKGARGACVLCILVFASACSYAPANREVSTARDTLMALEGVSAVTISCNENTFFASNELCADVAMKDGATLRFERIGPSAFGSSAVNVVVGGAGGLVPRIASCERAGSPNFWRGAALGHHFQPPLVDVKEAVIRYKEILEEVQFWPHCPMSWEVQDGFGTNFRYCAHRQDAPADPPPPEGCPSN